MVGVTKNGKNERVGRYLTEIKELPPSQEEEDDGVDRKPNLKMDKLKVSKDMQSEEKEKLLPEGEKKEETGDNQIPPKDRIRGSNFPLSARDIILGVVNLISVALLLVVLFKLPDRAEELNKLKAEGIKNEATISSKFGEIDVSRAKAKTLEELFLDESGVVDFIDEVERLKAEGSSINKITFASSEVVKDKTGNYGTPVIIEISGTWEQIGRAVQEIEDLPYIFRPVNISAEEGEEESVVSFTYGGFLYVDSRLGQN